MPSNKRKRFKGRPIDPALLGWATQVATVAEIDYSDLEEDDDDEDVAVLDEVDALAADFGTRRDAATGPRELRKHALANRDPADTAADRRLDKADTRQSVRARDQKSSQAAAAVDRPEGPGERAALYKIDAQRVAQRLAELDKLAVDVRMMAPTGLQGIDVLAKAYQAIEALANRFDPAAANAKEVREALQAHCAELEARALAIKAVLAAHPAPDAMLALGWPRRDDLPRCRQLATAMNEAIAATPPDAKAYAQALAGLQPLFEESQEEDAMAQEQAELLADLRDGLRLSGMGKGKFAEECQAFEKLVRQARDQRSTRKDLKALQTGLLACKHAFTTVRLTQLPLITPPTEFKFDKKTMTAVDAVIAYTGHVTESGTPFKKEKKALCTQLMDRIGKCQQTAYLSAKDLGVVFAETDDILEAIRNLPASLNQTGQAPKSMPKGTRKSKLPTLEKSVADTLPATERGTALTEAVREALKEPSWVDALIDFMAGRLALGRGDHIHLAGGGHTLIYEGDVVLGFMTLHLDRSNESQRQHNKILHRTTGASNVVDLAFHAGALKEVIPD